VASIDRTTPLGGESVEKQTLAFLAGAPPCLYSSVFCIAQDKFKFVPLSYVISTSRTAIASGRSVEHYMALIAEAPTSSSWSQICLGLKWPNCTRNGSNDSRF
jgi:hypothetical protein